LTSESADGLPRHHQLTQEFRLESTGSGAIQWLAGVYYFDEKLGIDSFSYSSIGGNTQNGYATQEQDNTAYAAFGSVNLAVNDKLKLRGGLRYTKDTKDFVATATASRRRLSAPPSLAGALRTPAPTTPAGDFSATYALADTVNVYGRVATGFRAPVDPGRLLFQHAERGQEKRSPRLKPV
jgi:iron complex outermembrane receptor protein